jgi:ribosomal protein L12E/L44/L45/RPP1/RPP2
MDVIGSGQGPVIVTKSDKSVEESMKKEAEEIKNRPVGNASPFSVYQAAARMASKDSKGAKEEKDDEEDKPSSTVPEGQGGYVIIYKMLNII